MENVICIGIRSVPGFIGHTSHSARHWHGFHLPSQYTSHQPGRVCSHCSATVQPAVWYVILDLEGVNFELIPARLGCCHPVSDSLDSPPAIIWSGIWSNYRAPKMNWMLYKLFNNDVPAVDLTLPITVAKLLPFFLTEQLTF